MARLEFVLRLRATGIPIADMQRVAERSNTRSMSHGCAGTDAP